MGMIEKRTGPRGVRYVARYRTPDGVQRAKTFTRKVDAEGYLADMESAKRRGDYVDPRRGKFDTAEWTTLWLEGKVNLAAKTQERYEGIVTTHVVQQWDGTDLGNVTHAEVQRWLSGLAKRLAPASVRKIHQVFSQAMAFAVRDGRLAKNPAAGVSLPRVITKEHIYLSHAKVAELAEACGPENDAGLVAEFLAYTGLRWGEMAALAEPRLDLRRRRAMIVESVTPVRGVMTWGPVKNYQKRQVPIPEFLVDPLGRRVKKRRGKLVFAGVKGGPLRNQVFVRAVFGEAVKAIGEPDLTPHGLRHTAASLAIASGADVKVVQTMLGHKSAQMTLDLYGHLFEDRLDEVALAMSKARIEALSALAA